MCRALCKCVLRLKGDKSVSLKHPNLSITNSQIKICSTASALEMADYIRYDFSTIKKAEEKICVKRELPLQNTRFACLQIRKKYKITNKTLTFFFHLYRCQFAEFLVNILTRCFLLLAK